MKVKAALRQGNDAGFYLLYDCEHCGFEHLVNVGENNLVLWIQRIASIECYECGRTAEQERTGDNED